MRECGGCTACCYVVEVGELRKPFRSPCPHCVEGEGCTVWGGPGGPGGAPIVCGTYACEWMRGHGEEGDRPDRSRVLVDLRLSKEGKPAYCAIGIEEGDEKKDPGRAALANIARDLGKPIHLTDKDLNVLEVIG